MCDRDHSPILLVCVCVCECECDRNHSPIFRVCVCECVCVCVSECVTGTTAPSSLPVCVSVCVLVCVCECVRDHSLSPDQKNPRRLWKSESKVRLSHIIQFFWHQNSCTLSLVVARLTPGIPFQ